MGEAVHFLVVKGTGTPKRPGKKLFCSTSQTGDQSTQQSPQTTFLETKIGVNSRVITMPNILCSSLMTLVFLINQPELTQQTLGNLQGLHTSVLPKAIIFPSQGFSQAFAEQTGRCFPWCAHRKISGLAGCWPSVRLVGLTDGPCFVGERFSQNS